MKKTILAAVIPTLFIANAACAGIKLVETDDITVDFNGDIDLKIVNMDNSEGTNVEANFDDLDFTFSYIIDENLKVIAETDFTMEYESGNELKNSGAWVGVETNYGLLRGGYQEISFDPLGIDNAELMPVGMSSGDTDAKGTTHESSVVYEYETENVWVSATYGREELESTGADSTLPEVIQMAAIVNIGELEVGGGYGHTETSSDDGTSIANEADYFQVQAEYDFGDLTMAALYGYQDEEVYDVQTQGIEFDMTYKITSNITVMGGFERLSQDISGVTGNEDLDLAYLGMTYKFNKYVKLYAEVGTKEGDYAKYGSNSVSSYDQEMFGLMLGVDF